MLRRNGVAWHGGVDYHYLYLSVSDGFPISSPADHVSAKSTARAITAAWLSVLAEMVGG